MRLSIRIGLAAVLIILAIVLLKPNIHSGDRSPVSFWHFDTTSFQSALRPEKHTSSGRRKWGTGSNRIGFNDFHTTEIEVPSAGVIVMGKLKAENTGWVSGELAEWRNYIYTVDDTAAQTHTPKNKGREALPYLQYLVDHYNDLPEVVLFLHSHRDGWPGAWHTDTMDYNNVDSVRALRREWVLQEGFVNLRCQMSPGCPAEMQPFRSPPQPGSKGEQYYAEAYKEIFADKNVPKVIGAPCCSQFAVSREQILQRPLSDYQRMYKWVLHNDLPDEVTSNIMEYSWHMIFGKEPVFCPDVFQCYADVYGEEVII